MEGLQEEEEDEEEEMKDKTRRRGEKRYKHIGIRQTAAF